MNDQNPVNPISPVVVVLCLAIVAVEMVLSAADAGLIGGARAVGWRLAAMQDYAFTPAVLDWIVTRGDYAPALLQRFVTYPFVHPSFTAALFGAALLLALGKFVGDVFHPVAVIALFLVTTVTGALVFGLLVGGAVPLLGAFPPVYGFIGAFTYVLWLRLGASGQNQLAAFRLIAFLLGLQLVFGLIFGSHPGWIAELAAFVIGFGISTILAPGGWAALMDRMRQRG